MIGLNEPGLETLRARARVNVPLQTEGLSAPNLTMVKGAFWLLFWLG